MKNSWALGSPDYKKTVMSSGMKVNVTRWEEQEDSKVVVMSHLLWYVDIWASRRVVKFMNFGFIYIFLVKNNTLSKADGVFWLGVSEGETKSRILQKY